MWCFCTEVMLRRSERLRNNGYYDMDGQPVISYRETPIRAIRRRITGRPENHPAVTFRERSHDSGDNVIDRERQMMMTLLQGGFDISVFVFLIFVTFGCICCIISFHSRSSELSLTTLTDMVTIFGRKDQRHLSNLELLEQKVDYLLPQADLWPNFALESQGANILHKMTSEAYDINKEVGTFGKLFKRPPIGPGIVIKGKNRLQPGKCWAFPGFQGRLGVSLSHPATIRHVSLGHIAKTVSPTSSVSSAPKEFSVYGKKNLEDEETHLGTFQYDEDGDQIQTFKLPADKVGSFRHVTLKVNSNWGHPDYTCLYNFRVHGEIAK
ncbi:SUN domain-containing protein 3-like isoform X1 [Poeciliopsis prolifica]|uniref:SUN domain-containing protein 3-like isoform X1 n=2 Tax=Poeciliopsis prolifica TaxID=188132 RepID=UPI002413E558|nr:SUN domain-containing protein 3-like isoform X1 [Poeciliopsis prolifica]